MISALGDNSLRANFRFVRGRDQWNQHQRGLEPLGLERHRLWRLVFLAVERPLIQGAASGAGLLVAEASQALLDGDTPQNNGLDQRYRARCEKSALKKDRVGNHFAQWRLRTIASLSRRMSSEVHGGLERTVSILMLVLYRSRRRAGLSLLARCCKPDSGKTGMRTVSAYESIMPKSSDCNSTVMRNPPKDVTRMHRRTSIYERRRLQSSATGDSQETRS